MHTYLPTYLQAAVATHKGVWTGSVNKTAIDDARHHHHHPTYLPPTYPSKSSFKHLTWTFKEHTKKVGR